jgi:hypothetical protein
MRDRLVVSGLSACLVVVGCGDPGSDAGESGTVTGVSASIGEETASNSGSSGPEGNGDGDGDGNSGPEGNGDGDGDPGDGDPGDGDPGDGDPGDGDGGFKFDIHGIPDGELDCQCGTTLDFSYIWIANSTQGTISKINTQTMVEEGRYQTRPDTNGSPSRTSVSLNANVAVANRNGGLTKFYANHADCPDSNGNGSVDTSTDATWEAWGDDECMAWHTPMAYASQRPVAWTQGEFDKAACRTINEKVWTSGSNGSIEVLLVDGDTGVIEETIPIPGVAANFYGIYGAAVDSEGNFWGSQLSQGSLVHVNRQTLAVETWPMVASGYGMTVDADGYVWTCSSVAARFDPATESWQQVNAGGGGGCSADANGILWMASNPVKGVNNQTLAVEYSLPIPEYVHGVSIDFEGNVWGVSLFGTNAYRIDPDTGLFDTFTGLVQPYSYSDMTGFALSNVGGGGAPSG